jgi:hypothetical protein
VRIAIVLLGLAASMPAIADDEAVEPEARPYRSAMMLGDVAASALFASGIAVLIEGADCDCEEMGSGYLIMFGGGAYLGVGPMLHKEHRRGGRALLSVVMRVALPIAGGIVGAAIDDEASTTAGFAAAGAATAMALDWTLLAW